MSDMSTTKIVAVLGGSYVGLRLARALAVSLPSSHRVVVVEAHSHFHHLFTFPRFAALHRGGEEKAFVPYSAVLPAPHSILHATATAVRPAEGRGGVLELQGQEGVKYDFLAIATGTRLNQPWNVEGSKKQGVEMLQSHQDRIRAAGHVVVVGGGAVGVQVAFDIRHLYPDKQVTLLHSRERVMNKFHPDLSKLLLGRFDKERIATRLGSRAVLPASLEGAKEISLQNGDKVQADLFLLCTGQTPRADFLPKEARTMDGFVKVRSTMQLEGRDDVFALGDVADSGAPKTVRAAMGQVEAVERNILALIAGKPAEATFTPGPAGIHLTLGLEESVKFGNPTNEGDAPRCLVEKDGALDMNAARMWANLNLANESNYHL